LKDSVDGAPSQKGAAFLMRWTLGTKLEQKVQKPHSEKTYQDLAR
jgi:hypothetical protein